MTPRQEALRMGEETYVGPPCKRAGHTDRYTRNGECIICAKTKNERRKKEAEVKGITYKGTSCSKGHTLRYTLSHTCVECSTEYHKNYPKEKKQEFGKVYRINNKEKEKLRHKVYRENNREKVNQWCSIWQKNNRDKVNVKNRYWKKAHPEAVSAYSSRVRAKRMLRVPEWVNIQAVYDIYKLCRKISNETGVLHHVDHIVPLCGELVSGLHVENNLRIIPAKENLSKRNHLIEELL